MAIVFLQLSPATSIGILIYLKIQQHEFNLKLNEIKLIPYHCKRFLNKDKSSARPPPPANHEKHVIFLHFVW